MGLLVDGKWKDQWYDTKNNAGSFKREPSAFRNWISRKPNAEFPSESDRYHLYVSHACPWAHRTLIFRKLKNLENIISYSSVNFLMAENGWEFAKDNSQLSDPLYGKKFLYEIYLMAKPNYSGRVTVPVLWDKKRKCIVNNESSEIIRMFNSEFNELTKNNLDFYPKNLRKKIDTINEKIYHNINNGVYKCGFATSQSAYDEAFEKLFSCLNELEDLLDTQEFLAGDQITEADWRLFTTLIRFDVVYVGHFKCNKKRIADYKNLSRFLKTLYNEPKIAETLDFTHIKNHYYQSHKAINPTGIVPKGPAIEL